MMQGKTWIFVLVALIIGFGSGFALRPVIAPAPSQQAAVAVLPPTAAPTPVAPRGKPYFAAHLDETRQVVAQCAEGSVRGVECAQAEQAVVEAEGRDRFKRFMGN